MDDYISFPSPRLSTTSDHRHSSLAAKAYGTISPCQTTPIAFFPPTPSRPTDPSLYPLASLPATPPPRYSIDGVEIDPRHPRYLVIALCGMLTWMGLSCAALALVVTGERRHRFAIPKSARTKEMTMGAVVMLAVAMQMLGTSALRRVVRMYMPREKGEGQMLGMVLAGIFYLGPAVLAVGIATGATMILAEGHAV